MQPNVYVTYQPKPNLKLIKTKTIQSSSSPAWDHEKIVKFNRAMISKQVGIATYERTVYGRVATTIYTAAETPFSPPSSLFVSL